MRAALHEHDVRGRPDLRDDRTLRPDALHGRLHLRNREGLRADEVRGRRAWLRGGELLQRGLQVRAGLPVRAIVFGGRSWLHGHFVHGGLHLSAELRLQPSLGRGPSL